MNKKWLIRVAAIAGFAVMATSAFGFFQDPTIHIDKALNDPTVTVKFKGAKVALIEIKINGRSAGTRTIDAKSPLGETSFTIDEAALTDGDNQIEVVLFDATGKMIGKRLTTISVERAQQNGPVYLEGLKPGQTIMGPVEIKVGMRREFKKPYVSFILDGQWLSMRNFPPYTYIWDSTSVKNGWHEFETWVVDGSLDTHKSGKVKVFVDNPGGRTDRPENPVEPVKASGGHESVNNAVALNSLPIAKPSYPTMQTKVTGTVGLKPTETPAGISTGPKNLLPTGKRIVSKPAPVRPTVVPKSDRPAKTISGPIGKNPGKIATKTTSKATIPTLPKVQNTPVATKKPLEQSPRQFSKIKNVNASTGLIRIEYGSKLPITGNYGISLDGRQVTFDVQPMVINGVPVTPFRHLFEAAGGSVKWTHETKEVHADGVGRKIWFQTGNVNAKVDEETIGLEKAPFIKGGRVILPLSFISSALDVAIHYDPATGHVLISSAKAKK